jgi:hypothetical protein
VIIEGVGEEGKGGGGGEHDVKGVGWGAVGERVGVIMKRGCMHARAHLLYVKIMI